MHSETSPRRKLPAPLQPVHRKKVNEVFCQFLEQLDTPRALAVHILFQHASRGDKLAAIQLLELECDPLWYRNPHSFALDWQATRLFSKYQGLKTGYDLEGVAVAAAQRAEALCKQTNERIRAYRSGNVNSLALDETILSKIQGLISEVLNDPITLDVVDVGWSSGRTTSAYGDTLDPISKYGTELDVTVSAQKWALAFLRDCPNWAAGVLDADGPCTVTPWGLNVVEGNVMLTVPKSAKTDRVICYEPHLNIRMQLAVGDRIKAALRKRGVNLFDQSVNQRRAKLGSKTGHLATIDLRSASDTVSLELIYLLFPVNWAMMLDDLRSKHTQWLDGIVRPNEKFSSMGNGFTFEIESLIFWAIGMAVCGSNVSVYGDDIIIPSEFYHECEKALVALGFELNTAKSFASGPFRESCGCDAFLGFDVTPFRVSEDIRQVHQWVLLHNSMRKWVVTHVPTRAMLSILDAMKIEYSYPMGPATFVSVKGHLQDYAQGHYHTCWDAATPRFTSSRETWCGWSYHQWVPIRKSMPVVFSGRRGFQALCATTGPKRLKEIDTSVDRDYKWVKVDSWAREWPSAIWV